MTTASANDAKSAKSASASISFHDRHSYHLLAAYLAFGTLHELSHLIVASLILQPTSIDGLIGVLGLIGSAARATLGRYSIVDIASHHQYSGNGREKFDMETEFLIEDEAALPRKIQWVLHSGWIFSVLVAIACHCLHIRIRNKRDGRNQKPIGDGYIDNMENGNDRKTVTLFNGIKKYFENALFGMFGSPFVPVAAYVTAMEAIVTDLLGFVPVHPYQNHFNLHNDQQEENVHRIHKLIFFCGNFGILLLNSSWLNIDGGRTALDVLEKMVNVTMMRGAQSGGVVTFEPINYNPQRAKIHNNNSIHNPPTPPNLKGIRSRVVNAKRTDLSKGVRRKIVSDNCSPITHNLRGHKASAFNINDGGGRLVRGFFGHTRFATSSKASFEGTHPHRWSERRDLEVYSFGSASASMARGGGSEGNPGGGRNVKKNAAIAPRTIGVENFVTHNGDFEFFKVNGKFYDVEVLQKWLENILSTPMPATVDSAAIAGMIDLLRTQGSFALSARYALCLHLPGTKVDPDPGVAYPSMEEYQEIGKVFDICLHQLFEIGSDNDSQQESVTSLEHVSSDPHWRTLLVSMVVESLRAKLEVAMAKNGRKHQPTSSNSPNASDVPSRPSTPKVSNTSHSATVDAATHSPANKHPNPPTQQMSMLGESTMHRQKGRANKSAMGTLSKFISAEDVEETDLVSFVQATIDAFFDNDLLHSTRLFLENAKGSFGLSVSSTLDAHRQVCFAARGQTLSIAFYPRKGLICYGSEQAAVKAGLNFENPGGNIVNSPDKESDNAVRLDLDDLGGEICLLDWGFAGDADPAISPPNRNLDVEKVMNGKVNVVLLHQSKLHLSQLSKRLTLLENNEFVKPLLNDCEDPVHADIRDIPRVCANIQDDWHDVGLNRMTAWNLANCVRARMKAHVDGNIKCHGGTVDILVTGCEVSLWVAEQFVSDLQKCFPKLFIRAVSSNKLLGLFGQELAMPCTGFPISQKSMDMKDPIVIIVSHSGGTFGPLACSNLLQSFSSSIFAVTSEWDTQIGKQLRSMFSGDDLLSSRIFSTEVGVRPAEPCSVSVVATHQLLTNIFEHICVNIISDPHFRHVSGAVVTERDLQILERCNQENLKALEDIVGYNAEGYELHEKRTKTEKELRAAGDLWADHILENVKAYIMTFIYIIGTVTSSYPLITGVAIACGMTSDWAFYITRLADSFIYFWLPQINVFILRLIQRRNLRHRMVGRTVVVGDCPWVSQAAEAFLSKIFACSYSIAGLNVLSGNPADHLVHRHTHRVVRGTLLVCGRPDGRLSALTSLEASTCLSVNQASSIQSLGGTCESITIGHNKSKLPLSHKAIYLKSHRPLFLCEKVLDDIDAEEDLVRQRKEKMSGEKARQMNQRHTPIKRASSIIMSTARTISGSGAFHLDMSLSRSRKAKVTRSSASLLGAYVNLEKDARKKRTMKRNEHQAEDVYNVIELMIKERQGIDHARHVFNEIDADGDGFVQMEEFIQAYQKVDANVSREHLQQMFEEADLNENGVLDFDEFLKLRQVPQAEILAELKVKNRDSRGLVQVQASRERYFGEELRQHAPPGVNSMAMSQSQHFSMELYESRIASMQRFTAMCVMFHQMGMRVQSFFPKISFGLLGYRMDRTHSIMRIATTASPVSGADVRERMEELRLMMKIDKSVQLIERTWKKWKEQKREQDL